MLDKRKAMHDALDKAIDNVINTIDEGFNQAVQIDVVLRVTYEGCAIDATENVMCEDCKV